MTSKIVVNNIEADAGVSTVTFGSNIQGNLIGNVTGNLTGNVTSSSTSTFSNGLNVTGGLVGIGTNNPVTYTAGSRTVHIHGDSNPAELRLTTSSSGVSAATDGAVLQLNGTSLALWNVENDAIRFGTNDTERLRITSTGGVSISNAGTFPTTTSETLNIQGQGHNGQGTTNTRSVVSVIGAITDNANAAGLWIGARTNENTAVIGTRTATGNLAIETYNSGWAERFRIDNVGRVTMPYQPYARVYYRSTPNLSYTAGNTYTIVFNDPQANVGGHYSNSTGRFTCPVAGKYLVMTALQFSVPTQNSWAYNVFIRVNGSAYAGTYQGTPAATAYESAEGYAIVNVSANDYIDIGVVFNASITHELLPGDTRNYAMFYLLG